MAALIVDWLGQGGIFQTSRAWARALAGAREPVSILTRSGGEAFGDDPVLPVTRQRSRIAAHLELVRRAASEITTNRPETVVVQNYLVPALELPVYRAARRAGSRVVFVVHNHHPHELGSGLRIGLARALGLADVVVTHSNFVANGLRDFRPGIEPCVVDHPIPLGLTELALPEAQPTRREGPRLAISFGVLKRGYKGTRVVEELAAVAPAGWRFALVGVGADDGPSLPALERVPGFIPDRDLVQWIQQADACLLPYRAATQSGAIALAQSLGRAVVASAVGGIPEQVRDGVNGRLVPPDATVAQWREVLADLDAEGLARMGEQARQDSLHRQASFVTAVRRIARVGTDA